MNLNEIEVNFKLNFTISCPITLSKACNFGFNAVKNIIIKQITSYSKQLKASKITTLKIKSYNIKKFKFINYKTQTLKLKIFFFF